MACLFLICFCELDYTLSKIPAFRQGKHSVRLYAVRTRRAQPGTPPAPCRGRKVKGVMQKKGKKGEPHEKENCHYYRTADPGRKSSH